MIIIGSVAAKLTGCLPTWRNGFTSDIDIVINSEQESKLLNHLSIDSLCVRKFSEFPDHIYILTRNRKLIDVTVSSLFHEMLTSCSVGDTGLLGVEAKYPDMNTLYALKEAYSDLPIHRDKNDKDLNYWRSEGAKIKTVVQQEIVKYVSTQARKYHK